MHPLRAKEARKCTESTEAGKRYQAEIKQERTWEAEPAWLDFRDAIRRQRRHRLLCKEFIRQEVAMAWMDVTTALDEAKGALANDAITFVSSVPGSGQPAETD